MAAPRLPFLWPFLFRTAVEAHAPAAAARAARQSVRRRALHVATQRRQQQESATQPRYGTANQPPPHLGGGKGLGPAAAKPKKDQSDEPTPLPKIGEHLQKAGEQELKIEELEKGSDGAAKAKKAEMEAEATTKDTSASKARYNPTMMMDPMMDSPEPVHHEKPPDAPEMLPDQPVEAMLSNAPGISQHPTESYDAHPEEQDSFREEHVPSVHPPHIEPPRYVHHFDTYGLVKRLTGEGGWGEEQAITMMKVTRLMLAENMDLARDALVSKSQIENETYLFKAACSELRTEATTRRKAEQEKMRTERTQLQHEVDILSQRIGQETAALKDDLKGMFDDRKIAIRSEQRDMESKLQQLNYKITVSLQADAKSDVEGVRWIMTRRVITALLLVVFMIVASLKLYSIKLLEQEQEAKRLQNSRDAGSQTEEGVGSDKKAVGPGVDKGYGPVVEDPEFVGLG